MEREGQPPLFLLVVAAITTLALVFITGQIYLSLGAGIIWLCSLWLMASRPPPSARLALKDSLDTTRLESVIEHASNPLLLISGSRIVFANRMARQHIGPHIVGQSPQIALRHPGAISLINEGANGGTQIHGLIQRKDVWMMNLQKISEKLALIELVDQTSVADVSRSHTDFVANASHELRTPLAAIIGYAETLRDTPCPPEISDKFLDTILAEAKRLQNIVMDLITLSYIEAEKHDPPRDVFPLSTLVEGAAHDAAGEGRKDRLSFELVSKGEVNGDPRQLEQLVRNLVDNALKYGADDKAVTISLKDNDSGEVLLSVSDKGEGIAAQHVPFLTRRFYRTDEGRSRMTGGTGLGLAIVKHIVERHNGRMNISSKVNVGTRVDIALPLVKKDAEIEA